MHPSILIPYLTNNSYPTNISDIRHWEKINYHTIPVIEILNDGLLIDGASFVSILKTIPTLFLSTSLDNLKLFIDRSFVDLLIGREDNKSFKIRSYDMRMTLTSRHFLPLNLMKNYVDEGFDFINVPSDTKFIFTVCEDFEAEIKNYSGDWNGVKYKIANYRMYKL